MPSAIRSQTFHFCMTNILVSKKPNETQAQPRLRQALVAVDFGILAEINMKS
jgi:hypothetical protein